MQRLRQLLRNEDGVTVVEYAVLVTLIILALLIAIGVFSGNLGDLYESFASAFD